jgi:adenosylcobyric acid synthase
MTARSVLFLGTSSDCGKTTIDALFCRWLKRKGVKVAPFKASNLSLNSWVTEDGREIGMGQAFQAWAAGTDPTGDMNPVLMKPAGNGRMQIMLRGRPLTDVSYGDDYKEKVMPDVCASYDRLREEYEAVVCEGSGSPAEINLMARDIANTGMMRARHIPCVLVGDIERGGVFAAIYGTWLIIPDDLKPLMKGFVINRFRGDGSILGPGIERIEKLTGMRFLGTVPFEPLKFPEEDSLSTADGGIGKGDVHQEFLRNLDSLLDKAEKSGVDFEGIWDIARSD